jgi:hypothetical protein
MRHAGAVGIGYRQGAAGSSAGIAEAVGEGVLAISYRLTPVRRSTRPTTGHKKPDPCASAVGFLSRVHMGPVWSSPRLRPETSSSPSDGGRDTAAALACGKPRAYFFVFLVFLATFLVAFAVFFAFFAFFAMSSSWGGWLDECADAANQRPRYQVNTKLAKTVPRYINARTWALQSCDYE